MHTHMNGDNWTQWVIKGGNGENGRETYCGDPKGVGVLEKSMRVAMIYIIYMYIYDENHIFSKSK